MAALKREVSELRSEAKVRGSLDSLTDRLANWKPPPPSAQRPACARWGAATIIKMRAAIILTVGSAATERATSLRAVG